MHDAHDQSLAREWLRAAADPAIAAEIDALHQMIADQVTAHAPVCVGSGRCCRFRDFGHLLYTTGLETACTLSRLPPGTALTPESVAAAVDRGDCPFLIASACSIHTIKPGGCRIYFCDSESHGWQQDLSERLIQHLRRLHTRFNIEYRYAEWRSLLALFASLPSCPHSGHLESPPTS